MLTLILWRLHKELKLEENMFSTAVKRNQIPIHLRQCCSELLAEQAASPRQGRDGGDVQPVGSGEWGWLGPQVLVLTARRASGTPFHGTSGNPKATECVK